MVRTQSEQGVRQYLMISRNLLNRVRSLDWQKVSVLLREREGARQHLSSELDHDTESDRLVPMLREIEQVEETLVREIRAERDRLMEEIRVLRAYRFPMPTHEVSKVYDYQG